MFDEENNYLPLDQLEEIENGLLEDIANKRINDYNININYDDGKIEVNIMPVNAIEYMELKGFVTNDIKPNLFTRFKNWIKHRHDR